MDKKLENRIRVLRNLALGNDPVVVTLAITLARLLREEISVEISDGPEQNSFQVTYSSK